MFHVKQSESQSSLLDSYLQKILELNQSVNLTAIRDFKQAKITHIEDSLKALSILNSAPVGLYGDLGTGAGFPGVPLALMSNRETILIDSTAKKIHAIQQALAFIGDPSWIHCYTGRIEDLALSNPEEFAVLTSRAMSSLPAVMELAAPLLKTEGLLICFTASLPNENYEKLAPLDTDLGLSIDSVETYTLPEESTERSLVVIKKIHKPHRLLPRRTGMAQKKPLIAWP